MKYMKSTLFLLLFYSYGCVQHTSHSTTKHTKASQFPVLSYHSKTPNSLNSKIMTAARNKVQWVFSPLLIAEKYQEYLGNSSASVFIEIENNLPEDATQSIVTVIEDGYADDSLRGQWTQLHLRRGSQEREPWKVIEIREAYLCGRMHSPKSFSKELCP